ncbi:hypothetical protein [Desulfosarcina sp.]|uniref:hypothetical protein n=1 Tax=Desulfosarcina sp. TaxID=2027861 RepID=UPI0029A5CA61|nr:hypothetical protein [Desulfosarcina sp.]MDX2455718.1 hypothetical protein [Desulfosarcina sp.]MDX2493191.1 hypothetical protein [Desulfosarcina sp.]
MILYYTNREISEKLEINLARWKRWSRSFLPPDPLGGMQSGYARQYTFKDLFKVYLGGHLLSHLKLSLPDSQQVLDDLSPWMKKNGFLDLNGANGAATEINGQSNGYRIYFCPVRATGAKKGSGFCYLIRKTVGTQSNDSVTGPKIKETVEETIIRIDLTDGCFFLQDPHVRMINFSPLFAALVKKLYHHPQ